MKAIIQIIRNKMRKVCAKILARCRQKAVLRGALPGGGIPVSCRVDLSLPYCPLLAAAT